MHVLWVRNGIVSLMPDISRRHRRALYAVERDQLLVLWASWRIIGELISPFHRFALHVDRDGETGCD